MPFTSTLLDGRIVVFGDHEERTLRQLVNTVSQEDGALGVECGDGHVGFGMPIGGVAAFREHLSPAGVGFDIGCGNLAVRTDVRHSDIAGDLGKLADAIFRTVDFGVGTRPRPKGYAPDHPVLDRIAACSIPEVASMQKLAVGQIGSVGGGNHYVDLFVDEDGWVWVGVHFGSRGFGWKTANGFMRWMAGLPDFFDHAPDGKRNQRLKEDDDVARVLPLHSSLGQAYLEAMQIAGDYAWAGREICVQRVLDVLGARALETVHNFHNYQWEEEHGGERFWVVRKGSTPAFPGQAGFVGSNMADVSVILEGVDSDESRRALYSTVHGAVRAMSRTQAAGKVLRRWTCNNRDCDWRQGDGEHRPADRRCPACGNHRLSKRPVRVRDGVIDWSAVLEHMRERGIELRGANAEEAPDAYKRLPDVLAHHDGTVRVLRELRPIVVCMADGDDQYKD